MEVNQMDIILHKFPMPTDGMKVIEEVYCKLLSKQRAGEQLDLETLDWLDQANNWLIAL